MNRGQKVIEAYVKVWALLLKPPFTPPSSLASLCYCSIHVRSTDTNCWYDSNRCRAVAAVKLRPEASVVHSVQCMYWYMRAHERKRKPKIEAAAAGQAVGGGLLSPFRPLLLSLIDFSRH